MKRNPTATKMAALRSRGYKIKVMHYRMTQHGMKAVKSIAKENAWFAETVGVGAKVFVIQPCGGRVEVEILTPEGTTIKAVAECSEKDNFKRTVGTAIAFGRALKELKGGHLE